MLTLEHYIWKAKKQHGLSDEQIQYFLERDSRYELLPYFTFCCKRLGAEDGYNKMVEMYGLPEEKKDG